MCPASAADCLYGRCRRWLQGSVTVRESIPVVKHRSANGRNLHMARYRRNGSLPSRAEGPSQSSHEAVAGSMSQKGRMRQNASVNATTEPSTACATVGTDLERVDFTMRPPDLNESPSMMTPPPIPRQTARRSPGTGTDVPWPGRYADRDCVDLSAPPAGHSAASVASRPGAAENS
jgi:hypothetical protein